ncbi:MAG: hypothetical protein GTN36_00395 [Candidatus Aenigmarchaeota archaeon]|nr:hypothetical protein [Candidatus Aenigmarchaeota archaeon]
MSSIAAQYIIDNEQEKGRYVRLGRRGIITGIVNVSREILRFPYPTSETEEVDLQEIIENEFLEEPEKIERREIDGKETGEIEMLKVDIIVPYLSEKGKSRLLNATSDQGLDLDVKCIERDEVKKYLLPGENFVTTNSGKLKKIRVTGVQTDYTDLPILTQIDTILGFPDCFAEKLNSFVKMEKKSEN